jgi:hypothetical protein
MPRQRKQLRASRCNAKHSSSSNNVSDELPETSNTSDELPERNNTSDELPERNNTSVELPERNNTSDEVLERNNTSVELPEMNNTSDEVPERNNTSDELAKLNITSCAKACRKRGSTSFLAEYVSPKRNHPIPSKFRSPRNRRDVEKPKLRKPVPQGRRMFTIGAVEAAMNIAVEHTKHCSAANFYVKSEKVTGLSCKLEVKCTNCNRPSQWISNDDAHCTLPVNEAAIWGANATGIGFTSLKHSLAVLDVPVMSNKTFTKMENEFADKLQVCSKDQFFKNGEDEYSKAIDLGQFISVDGVKIAWTSVNVDGQWSKRCFNQAGTANSGSACIIGLLTKKPLYVGVRNKFCLICRKHKSTLDSVPEHKCFKNWGGPSSAMEADIIAEGFRESVATHKMMYKFMIGDGDSSVHNEVRLVYHKPELEYTVVEKIECKNHAIRRMNKKLLALLTQRLFPSAHRKVLEERIAAIGKCCAYVIQHNFDNKPVTNAKTLKFDLENVIFHVFGDHSKCKQTNCMDGKSIVPSCMMKSHNVDTVAARKSLPCTIAKIVDHPIWNAMMEIVAKLASHSLSLMYACTTNMSESFQSHVNKVLQGRRIHYSARGGYNRKTAAASFSFQYGQGWYGHAYRQMYEKSPSKYWKSLDVKINKSSKSAKPKSARTLFQKFNKPKYLSRTYIESAGDEFYGENARKVDMSPEALATAVEDLRKSLKISTKTEQFELHTSTIGQWENPKYLHFHRNRITASKCGVIFTLRDKTSNVSAIDSILHSSFSGNEATAWGKINERRAVSCYEKLNKLTVSPAGLFVSLQDGVLAASPDGLVGNDGVVEIKCPFIEKNGKPSDVANRKTNKYLVKSGSGFSLSQTSHYFYQVVMQLHTTERVWCDFIIWTQGPTDPTNSNVFLNPAGDILVTRILRSDTNELWQRMSDKLLRFWSCDLAPEIVDSRRARRDGYRQPSYREDAIRENSNCKILRINSYDESIDSVLSRSEEV